MPRSGSPQRRANAPSHTASMRPGQSCPGVGGRSLNRSPSRDCFNEAGAIMPRSGSGREALRRLVARFNEAGAIMPRSGHPRRAP